MTTPKVIVRNGKRYVQIGKKFIKVDSSLTERELIKWMIKYFKPKRRKTSEGKRMKDVWTEPPLNKATVFQSGTVVLNDMNRAQAREVKDQLEATQKKLKESEDNFKKIAEETKKAIEAPKRLIEEKEKEHKDDSERIPLSEEEVRRQEGIKHQKEEEGRNEIRAREAKEKANRMVRIAELKAEKARKIELRGVTFDAQYTEEKKKQFNNNTAALMRNWMSEHANKVYSITPSTSRLRDDIEKAGGFAQLKEKIRVAVNNVHNPEIAALQTEIDKLEKEIAGEGRSKDIPAEGISDFDINRAMKDYKQFLGAIAADEIHSLVTRVSKEKRICWIQNTEPRAQGGAHWVSFLIDARPHGTMSVEYYDPLGDPITPGFLRDVKVMIKAVHGSDSYLKYRENKIPDQSDISNNCGPFAIRFLQARLAGESFAKATGWDKQGEKNIELWKKHPKQQTWISSQNGEGFRDIFAAVRKGATKIYERIKATLSGPRGGAPPAVRGWLAKYGDVEIQNVWVCKKPIYSILENLANWLSQGKLRENMDRLGYEQLMHLYMIVQLRGKSADFPGPTVKIEKNHVVEIKNSGDLGQKHMSTDHPSTVNQMIKTAEASHGESVWKYHLVDANCQKFIMWCLGSKASTIREFVMQDVENSLKDMGLFKKIATVVTDVAGAADIALNGTGTQAFPGHVSNQDIRSHQIKKQ